MPKEKDLLCNFTKWQVPKGHIKFIILLPKEDILFICKFSFLSERQRPLWSPLSRPFFHHLTRLCSSRRPETLLFEFLSPRQISPTFDENLLTLPLRFGSPLDTTLSFILFNYYSIVLLFFFSFLHLIM